MSPERTLNSYPRPNVAIDLAVLTVLPDPDDAAQPGQLAILVQQPNPRAKKFVLPGRFLREEQTFVGAAGDVFTHKIGLQPPERALAPLRVFDAPRRDPRGWTITLAYSVTLPHPDLEAAAGTLVPIDVAGHLVDHPRMQFDHDEIVAAAAASIRERYENRPDPDHLIGRTFTMTDLRLLHEAVLGEKLLHDTFKRRMREHLAEETDEDGKPLRLSSGGRPAQIYSRLADGSDQVTESERKRLQLPRA